MIHESNFVDINANSLSIDTSKLECAIYALSCTAALYLLYRGIIYCYEYIELSKYIVAFEEGIINFEKEFEELYQQIEVPLRLTAEKQKVFENQSQLVMEFISKYRNIVQKKEKNFLLLIDSEIKNFEENWKNNNLELTTNICENDSDNDSESSSEVWKYNEDDNLEIESLLNNRVLIEMLISKLKCKIHGHNETHLSSESESSSSGFKI